MQKWNGWIILNFIILLEFDPLSHYNRQRAAKNGDYFSFSSHPAKAFKVLAISLTSVEELVIILKLQFLQIVLLAWKAEELSCHVIW